MIKRRYETLNAIKCFNSMETMYAAALLSEDVVNASFSAQQDDELLFDVDELLRNLENELQ